MPKVPKGNRDLIRSINRSIVLNTIKTKGSISRAELALVTKLSPATITSIAADLLKEQLVLEKEVGVSSGGRRPIMLTINPMGRLVIGVKLMENHAVAVLTDLNCKVLFKDTIEISNDKVEMVVNSLVALVNDIVTQASISKKQLLGVGVGLAGVVDSKKGILRQNPFFGWKDTPLRDLLQVKLKVPVYIENDVNALTIGENWLGSTLMEDNFIVITVGRGIGMGVVANGQIYRGTSGGAGEFGHICVDPNGPLCDCGKHGCLESFLGDRALLNKARNLLNENALTFDDFLMKAYDGIPEAVSVLVDAGNLLGLEIANLVNLLDPKMILISGEGTRMGELFFSPLQKSYRQHLMPGLAQDTEIRVIPWDDNVWARAAASVVIGELFNYPIQSEGGIGKKSIDKKD